MKGQVRAQQWARGGLGLLVLLAGAGGAGGNVLVNQDPPPRIQNSPGVCIDRPSGNTVIAYVDDPWGFNGIGASRAPGGNGPWSDASILPPPTGWDRNVMDPSIASDQAGWIYACGATYDQFPPSRTGIFVHGSTDGGASFGTPGIASFQAGAPGTIPLDVKPKVEVDDWPGSPFYRRVYAVWERDLTNWRNSSACFSWSPSGGAAWSPAQVIDDNIGSDLVLWPDLAVGPDGRVFAAWLDSPFWVQMWGNLFVDRSTNGGQTFGPDRWASGYFSVPSMLTDALGIPTHGAMSYPSIEVDPSNPNRVGIVYAADPDVGPPAERRLDIGDQPPGNAPAQVNQHQPGLTNSNGWTHAAWTDTRNATSDIYYRRCYTASGSWGPEVNLTAGHPGSSPNSIDTPPALASSGSNVYAVWIEGAMDAPPPPAGPFVHFTRSTDDGQTWSSVVHLDTQALSPTSTPVIACRGNNVRVAWNLVRYPNGATIYANSSNDGGLTWQSTESVVATIPGNPWLEVGPCSIASDWNNVYVIWDQRLTTYGRDICVSSSTDGGLTWSAAPTRLDRHDNTGYSWSLNPRICSDGNGNVYAAWYDDAWAIGSTRHDPTLARSTDYGASWLHDVRLNAGVNWWTWDLKLDITFSGIAVFVVYQSDRNTLAGLRDIYVSRSIDGGGTWGATDIRLDVGDPPEANDSGSPSIDFYGGSSVYAAWVDSRNGQSDIYGNLSTDSGQTWSAVDTRLDVGDAPGAAASVVPSVVGDMMGACVLWQDVRNGWEDVYVYQTYGNGPDEGNIYYVESTNGGVNWAPAILVNDDGTRNDQSHPWIDIKPNGTVDVVWYDKRLDPMDRTADVYFAALLPGAARFTTNTRVTSQPIVIPTSPGMWIGDYIGLDVDAVNAQIAWTDTRLDPPMADIFFDIRPNPGQQTGACCQPGGGCIVTTASACLDAGGIFMGEGVDCEPDPCVDLPDWADHDVGDCVLTVTDAGILGFMDCSQAEGSGFVVPRYGGNQLYIGSVWISRDPGYVANRDYDADPRREWVVSRNPDGRVHIEENGDSDQDITVGYRDDGGGQSLGLYVQQESWAYAGPDAADDFVIVNAAIRNDGLEPLGDLFAGVFLDLDLEGVSDDDAGAADPAGELAYLGDPSGVHAGVVLLRAEEDPVPLANLSLVYNPTFVWPNAYMPDSDKYGFLVGADPDHRVLASFEPNDWSIVASVGPFFLAPGETREVSFAIVGGVGLDELLANASMARTVYQHGMADAPDGAVLALGETPILSSAPNPCVLGATVRFALAEASRISLDLYDVGGRSIRTLAGGIWNQGPHAVWWDGRDRNGDRVPAGVYFLKLTAGGRGYEQPLLIVR